MLHLFCKKGPLLILLHMLFYPLLHIVDWLEKVKSKQSVQFPKVLLSLTIPLWTLKGEVAVFDYHCLN